MPGFDRSGPMGAGPMTGWGKGWCRRPVEPMVPQGYGTGRGMGFRRGFGRGVGRGAGPWFGGYAYPPAAGAVGPQNSADELDRLRADADAMRTALESIQRRIAVLETETGE